MNFLGYSNGRKLEITVVWNRGVWKGGGKSGGGLPGLADKSNWFLLWILPLGNWGEGV